MFIHEAIEKSLKENKEICRESARDVHADVFATIRPTNSYEACILVINQKDTKKSCRNWNPTADDLIADDWIVV